MAYTFTDLSANRIAVGAPANANTFSFFARFILNADTGGGGANRWLASFNNAAISQWQLALLFPAGTTNQLAFNITKAGGTSVGPAWTTGWSTPSTHSVCCTYDQTQLAIYADGSSTAKATTAETAAPDQGSQTLTFGAIPTLSDAAPMTLYEAAWWAGTALTAAQAGAITAGNPGGIVFPTDYWGLVNNANDLFGSNNGTVTGASLVAHAGSNLYPKSFRRSLSSLGTRVGTRQVIGA
jgi:hypothetical protein